MELALIIAFLVVMWVGLRHDIKGQKRTTKRDASKKAGETSSEQYVYVISNPSYNRGIFKIGLTTQLPEKRMKQLFSTGVPTPFQVCMLIKTDDCKALEKEIHNRFAIHRISPNREFFRLGLQEINVLRKEYLKTGDQISTTSIREALGLDGLSELSVAS
ncbi:hypothetical protein VPHD148_0293 [Vibrio phage D148]